MYGTTSTVLRSVMSGAVMTIEFFSRNVLPGTSLFLYRAKIGRNVHKIVVYFFCTLRKEKQLSTYYTVLIFYEILVCERFIIKIPF